MTKKTAKAIQFNVNAASNSGEYTLIPVGKYTGTIEQAKMVVTRQGEERLWVGVRITGQKQAGRFITTLCTLNDKEASAYKTAGLAKAAPAQFDAFTVHGDPTELIGAFVSIDVVIWTPKNSGNAVNDIRNFTSAIQKNAVQEFVAEVAESFAIPETDF